MFYLIFVLVALLFSFLCLIFQFLPLVKATTRISYWASTYLDYTERTYSYSILDYLSEPFALLSFIFSIVTFILLCVLAFYFVKRFQKEKALSNTLIILNIVTSAFLCLFCVFVLQFMFDHTNGSMTYDTFYVIEFERTAVFVLYFIFSIISFVSSLVALFICVVSKVSKKLGQKKFFILTNSGDTFNKLFSAKNNENGAKKEDEPVSEVAKEEKNLQNDSAKLDLLLRLNQLKDSGVITEEEFEQKKKEYLK